MQTKHLHWILPIFLLIGCRAERVSSDNPYLTDNKAVALSSSSAEPFPVLLFGRVDLSVAPPSDSPEPFVFQIYPHSTGRGVGGLQVDGFNRRAVRVSRTISSLIVEDTASSLTYAACVLPGGDGLAFYLEGETYSTIRFSLAQVLKDTLFLRGNKTGEREVFYFPDSFAVVVRAKPAFVKSEEFFGGAIKSFARELNDGKRRQVVLAYARDPETAEAIADVYLGMSRKDLERAARDSLASSLAFSLKTDDDRTNRVSAILGAALTHAGDRTSLSSPAAVTEAAAVSRASFLAARERSKIVFGAWDERTLERCVRWGSEAYRAAFAYGMADDDSLKRVALDVLTEVARLNREYAGSLFALDEPQITDTLTRLAVTHVRYADLLSLCGDISNLRGNREAETAFRKDASRAGKQARRYFDEAEELYRGTRADGQDAMLSRLEMISAEIDSVEPDIALPAASRRNPPDTLRLVQEGAHCGFTWLSDRPAEMIPDSLDGFSWQKWTAFRFAGDYSVTQTPDLDSVNTLLLQGPMPGTLTNDPGRSAEPSLPVMAAAFQNLAEVYLGVHPDWQHRRLEILPRRPQNWGHTVARVPIGSGTLDLDFDFENNKANVGISGMDGKLDVMFGYPLPSGGFTRTQFALSPDEPRVHIKMQRDRDNRVRVIVNPD